MSNNVYANGREIACKAGMGKSIAAFPDTCLSPPTPPAGPVPIPYPLTAMDSDTDSGSKNVKISDKEVMLKSDSSFKTCMGDEAATKSLGMGVVTHQITGKVYFIMWSMDVKIEGANAVRHLDQVTHNHMSTPGNTPPWTFAARAQLASQHSECDADVEKAEKACTTKKGEWKKSAGCPKTDTIDASKQAMADAKAAMEKSGTAAAEKKYEDAKKKWNDDYDAFAKSVDDDPCQSALRCLLVPYAGKKGEGACCQGQTGDHLIDAACFHNKGRGDEPDSKTLPGCSKYDTNRAPVMCVEGQNNTQGTHGDMHTIKGHLAKQNRDSKGKITLAEGKEQAKEAVETVFPDSACSGPCIEAQLKKYHNDDCKMDDDQKIRGAASGRTSDEAAAATRTERASPGPND